MVEGLTEFAPVFHWPYDCRRRFMDPIERSIG
jgi:hypothetical protein